LAFDEKIQLILKLIADTKSLQKEKDTIIDFFKKVQEMTSSEHLVKVLFESDAKKFEDALASFIKNLGLTGDQAENAKKIIVNLRDALAGLKVTADSVTVSKPSSQMISGYNNIKSAVENLIQTLKGLESVAAAAGLGAQFKQIQDAALKLRDDLGKLEQATPEKLKAALPNMKDAFNAISSSVVKLREDIAKWGIQSSETLQQVVNNASNLQDKFGFVKVAIAAFIDQLKQTSGKTIDFDVKSFTDKVALAINMLVQLQRNLVATPKAKPLISKTDIDNAKTLVAKLQEFLAERVKTGEIELLPKAQIQLLGNLIQQLEGIAKHKQKLVQADEQQREATKRVTEAEQKTVETVERQKRQKQDLVTMLSEQYDRLHAINRVTEQEHEEFKLLSETLTEVTKKIMEEASAYTKASSARKRLAAAAAGDTEKEIGKINSLVDALSREKSEIEEVISALQAKLEATKNNIRALFKERDAIAKNIELKRKEAEIATGAQAVKAQEELKLLEERRKVIDKMIERHAEIGRAQERNIEKHQRTLNTINEQIASIEKLRAEMSAIPKAQVAPEGIKVGKLPEWITQLRNQAIGVDEFRQRVIQLTDSLRLMLMAISEDANAVDRYSESIKRMTGVAVTGATADERAANAKKILSDNLEKVNAQIKKLERNMRAGVTAATGFGQNLMASTQRIKDFNFFMEIAIEKIIRYRVAFRTLQKAIQAFKQSLTIPIEIEHAMAQIEKVITDTTASMTLLGDAAAQIAFKFGVEIQDVIDIMKVWAQQGKTQAEILELTKATLFGVVGANLEAKQAVEALTSAIRVYNIDAQDSIVVIDKLLNVQRNFAITAQDLADAIKLLGSTAKVVGIDIDGLIAMVTAIAEVTRKSGKNVANSLKTMFARFTKKEAIDAFRNIGVAILGIDNQIRDLDDVLLDLALKWNTLTREQKVNIARTVGGIRRYADFMVLMDNFGTVLRAQEKSFAAQGDAQRAASIELDTLKNKIQALKDSYTIFQKAVGDADVGLKSMVSSLLGVSNIVVTSQGELTAFGKAIANIVSVVETLGVSLLVWKGIMVALQLAQNKVRGTIVDNILATVQFTESGRALNAEKQRLIAQLLVERGLHKELNRALKEGVAMSVVYGEGEEAKRAMIERSTLAIAKQTIALESLGAAQQKITSMAGGSFLSRFFFGPKGFAGASTAMKLFGAFGIVLGIILPLLLSLKDIFGGLKRSIDEVTVSLQTQLDNLSKWREAKTKVLDIVIKGAAVASREAKIIQDQSRTLEERNVALANFIALAKNISSITGRKIIEPRDVDDADTLQRSLRQIYEVMLNITQEASEVSDRFTNTKEQVLEQLKHRERLVEQSKRLLEITNELNILYEDTTKKIQKMGRITQIGNIEQLFKKAQKTGDFSEFAKALARGDEELERMILRIAELEKQRQTFKRLSKDLKILVKDLPESDEFRKIVENQLVPALKDAGKVGGIEFFKGLMDSLKQYAPRDFGDKLADEMLKSLGLGFESFSKEHFDPTKPFLLSPAIIASVKTAAKNLDVADAAANIQSSFDEMNKSAMRSAKEIIESFEEMRKGIEHTMAQARRKLAAGIIEFKRLSETITSLSRDAVLFGESFDVLDQLIAGERRYVKTVKDSIDILRRRIDEIETENRLRKERLSIDEQKKLGKIRAITAEIFELNQKITEIQSRTVSDTSRTKLTEEEQKRVEALKDRISELRTELSSMSGSLSTDTNQIIDALLEMQRMLASGTLEGLENAGKLSEFIIQRIDEIVKKETERKKLTKDQAEALREELRLFAALAQEHLKLGEALNTQYAMQKLQEETMRRTAQSQTVLKKNVIELASTLLSDIDPLLLEMSRKYRSSAQYLDAIVEKQKLLAGMVKAINMPLAQRFVLLEKIYNTRTKINGLAYRIVDIAKEELNLTDEQRDGLQKYLNTMLNLTDEMLKQKLLEDKIKTNVSIINAMYAEKRDMLEAVANIEKGIAGIVGENLAAAYKRNIDYLKRSLDLEKERKIAIAKMFYNVMASTTKSTKAAEELAKAIDAINRHTELQFSIESMAIKLETITKHFERVRNVISDIANVFAGFFARSMDIVIDRNSQIAQVQEDIYNKNQEIKDLHEQLADAIREGDLDAQKQINEELRRANEELNKMKDKFDDLTSIGGTFKAVLGALAEDVADMIVDIRTEELKRSLTDVMMGTSFAEQIAQAVSLGFTSAESEFIHGLASELGIQAQNFNAAIVEGGLQIASALEQVFSDATIRISAATHDMIDTAINGPNSLNNQASDAALSLNTLKMISDQVTESFQKLNDIMEQLIGTAEGGAPGPGETPPPPPKPGEEPKPEEKTGATPPTREERLEKAKMQRLIAQLASFMGMLLSQALVKARTPKEARGAYIGSTIGSLLGQMGATAMHAGPLVGAALATVGSIAGALLGKTLAQEKANERALKENTNSMLLVVDGLQKLTSTMEDMRERLIGAPTRFTMPANVGFGDRFGSGFAQIGNQVIVNLPANTEIDATTFAEDVANAVNVVYAKQARRTGFKPKLF
jgi:TP901 family phage tail tape measure protein